MNDKFFTDGLSEETIVNLTDGMLKEENINKNTSRRGFGAALLKAVPIAAMIALVIGLVNIAPRFLNNPDSDAGDFHAGISTETDIVRETNNITNIQESMPNADDYDLAYFEPILNDENIIIGISGIYARFNGDFTGINPDDFNDMALTKDGAVVDNKLKYNAGNAQWYDLNGEHQTYFYFEFEHEIREPGVYKLSGNYKGFCFRSPPGLVESYPLGDTPADPDDLDLIRLSIRRSFANTDTVGISFDFRGAQDAFYMSDLTELKLILNGEEIAFSPSFGGRYIYSMEWCDGGGIYTQFPDDEIFTGFSLICGEYSTPGNYQLTGKYRGLAFESNFTILNEDGSFPCEPEIPVYFDNPQDAYGLRSVYFDVIREADTANIAIPNLIIYFHGLLDSIDPDDFTDMVLTRDGIIVENKLTYRIVKYAWAEETAFEFSFEHENREPGRYELTGKYKGVAFKTQICIVETYPFEDIPESADIYCDAYAGVSLDGVIQSFHIRFYGLRHQFYVTDLTDLKLTVNGEEIEFKLKEDSVSRYLHAWGNDVITSFYVDFEEYITTSGGTYQFTGKYMGVPFESSEITIP